jgi:hypothetical protein
MKTIDLRALFSRGREDAGSLRETGVDDVEEGWLERGPTHEEPVHLFHGDKFGTVLLGDTAPVNNS